MNSRLVLRSRLQAQCCGRGDRLGSRGGHLRYSAPARISIRQKLERVGDFFRDQLRMERLPGAILLIQQHGKPVYHEFLGVRDVATKQPMTDDTIFRLFSMTKPITSVVAMIDR